MIPFELLEPQTLPEALALLSDDDAGVRPIGGGTALMLMMKAAVLAPTRLVSLRGLHGALGGIVIAADGALQLGGMTSLSSLEHSPLVAQHAPVLARAMTPLSNVRVRNVATVGGALAHADPHMDLPPVLAALDARVQIAGPSGTRELSIEELITGYYETALNRNEIITGVKIPVAASRAAGRLAAYLKVTTRAADDWPALGVAVSFLYSNKTISESRVVIGAATDRPTRAVAAEALLDQTTGDATTLLKASDALVAEVQFTSDAQGSAAYKRQLARVHLARAVNAALALT